MIENRFLKSYTQRKNIVLPAVNVYDDVIEIRDVMQ